ACVVAGEDGQAVAVLANDEGPVLPGAAYGCPDLVYAAAAGVAGEFGQLVKWDVAGGDVGGRHGSPHLAICDWGGSPLGGRRALCFRCGRVRRSYWFARCLCSRASRASRM